MQFLVNVIDDGQAAAVGNTYSATDAEAAAVDARAGAGDAATGPATAGRATTGPATATDEYVAGFWVMELPDAETAARVAHQASQACNRKIELRPLL
jgi:hypothetical protein